MKNKIVERLLKDNHITAEEATILLKEVHYIAGIDRYKDDNRQTTYGDICPCNPKNGGSGICSCVMGNKVIETIGKKAYIINENGLIGGTVYTKNSDAI